MKRYQSWLLIVSMVAAVQVGLAAGPTGAVASDPIIVLPDDPATEGWFGYGVAIDGATLVAASPGADGREGAVYVFEFIGGAWVQQAKLTSPAAVPRSFGDSVALEGDTIVVADNQEYDDGHPQAGAVYVYTRTSGGWSEPERLVPDDPSSYKWFGSTFDLSGNSIVVGAYGDWINGLEQVGSAYVFVRVGDSWTQQAKLLDAVPEEADRFGYDVAIDDDTVVVRAITDDSVGFGTAGTVNVYSRHGATWSREGELISLMVDERPRPARGERVVIDGDWIAVGAEGDETVFGFPPAAAPNNGGPHEQGSGAVYMFQRVDGFWRYEGKLIASDAVPGDDFGLGVALSGKRLLVSAYSDQRHGVRYAGSAYLFRLNQDQWQQRAKYAAPVPGFLSLFGWDIDLDGKRAVIGAGWEHAGGREDSGSVYVFAEPKYRCGGELATLVGGDETDQFTGSAGVDVIVGLEGDDILRGRGGGDSLCGGPGNDVLRGGSGNDHLSGGRGNDTIYPGAGNDRVAGGGSAHDTVSYVGSGRGVLVSLLAGTASGSGDDTLASIEHVVGSQFADELIGNRKSNHILGRRGADVVRGRAGDDYIWGNGGPDVLSGGGGSDTIFGGAGADTCVGEFLHEC